MQTLAKKFVTIMQISFYTTCQLNLVSLLLQEIQWQRFPLKTEKYIDFFLIKKKSLHINN